MIKCANEDYFWTERNTLKYGISSLKSVLEIVLLKLVGYCHIYNDVESSRIESFRTVARSVQSHYLSMLNFSSGILGG